jgi:hypothetical protein
MRISFERKNRHCLHFELFWVLAGSSKIARIISMEQAICKGIELV